jgi:FkbM family methyltransferase
MDVGGNIGAFSIRAAMEGADLVYTYEPHPDNYKTLVQNCGPYPVIKHFEAALTQDPDGSKIPLYITNDRTLGSCSVTEFRGRSKVIVKTMNFFKELIITRASSIKMDCEGAEWSLLSVMMPDWVTDIAAELHFTKKYWRTDYYPRILKHMEDQGFQQIHPAVNTGKNFHTLVHWRR